MHNEPKTMPRWILIALLVVRWPSSKLPTRGEEQAV